MSTSPRHSEQVLLSRGHRAFVRKFYECSRVHSLWQRVPLQNTGRQSQRRPRRRPRRRDASPEENPDTELPWPMNARKHQGTPGERRPTKDGHDLDCETEENLHRKSEIACRCRSMLTTRRVPKIFPFSHEEDRNDNDNKFNPTNTSDQV